MAADALLGSNAHSGISAQKADAVRYMDRYIRETTLELNSARRDLSEQASDTRLFRFHAHLGDFAGALCSALQDKKRTPLLLDAWTKIVTGLDEFDKRVADWEAKGQLNARPHSALRGAIEDRVHQLVQVGFDLDIDLALHAIRSYARRNFISHGEAREKIARTGSDPSGLVSYLDDADKTLESVLPDEEKPNVGQWRRLLTFYRHLHIRTNEDGGYDFQDPLEKRMSQLGFSRERSPPPLSLAWKAEICESFENGKFRPSGSDGPPPNGVSYSPSSVRRLSEPKTAGVKRPAVEQLFDQSRVKRVKAANDTGASLGAIPVDHSDPNAVGVLRALRAVQRSISVLAESDHNKASQVLVGMQSRMDGELEEVRIAAEARDKRLSTAERKKGVPRVPKEERDLLDNDNLCGDDEDDADGGLLGFIG